MCLRNIDALLFQHCTYSQGQSFPKKQRALSIPTPRAFCALLPQAISESTSHTFTCKKLWIPLEVRHGTKFPRICLESQCQATSARPQASSRGCDSCEESSVVLRGCKGTQQHMQTSAASEGTQTRQICQVPHASNNSDVSRSAEYRRPWGGGSEWPHLG